MTKDEAKGFNWKWMTRQELMVKMESYLGYGVTGAMLNRVTDVLIHLNLAAKRKNSSGRASFQYASHADWPEPRIKETLSWQEICPKDVANRLKRLDEYEYTPNEDALDHASLPEPGEQSWDHETDKIETTWNTSREETEPEVTLEDVETFRKSYEALTPEEAKDIRDTVIDEALNNGNWNGVKNLISLP